MVTLLRKLFVIVARLFPREHGKYSILTRLYFPLFAKSAPTQSIEKVRFGIKLSLNLQEYLQSWIYVFGAYELPTVKFIRSYLRPGDTAIDVGGQIGYLSLVMATSADRAVSVLSFEPEHDNIRRFRTNVSLNQLRNIELIEQAAASSVGTLKLYLSADSNAGTHSTIRDNENVSDKFIEIPCTTIDHEVLNRSLERVDLIKIDVEGGEIDVIKGALNTLSTLRPVVITELGDALQKARGLSTDEFKSFLSDLGYECYRINDNGTLALSPLGEYHLMDNVVFVPENRKSRVIISL